MKNLMIIFLFLSSFLLANVATVEIDKMIDDIKAPRKGVDLKELSATLNPFVAIKEDVNDTIVFAPKKKFTKMTLGGIVNDKAYINDSWYREGDPISEYTLKYIGVKGVVLVKGRQIKKIFLHEDKKNLIIMKDDKK